MDRDPRPVQADEHGFGFDTVHTETDERGQPGLGIRWPDEPDPLDGQCGTRDVIDVPPGGGRLVVYRAAVLCCERGGGGTERQQGRDRLEPTPAPTFLLAADEQRFEAAAPADHECPGAGHAAELVRARC